MHQLKLIDININLHYMTITTIRRNVRD